MAGRKKIQFTEEQNKEIISMVSENKNLNEMLDILLSKYDLKIAKATLASHIRTICSDWQPVKAGRKESSDVKIDIKDLLTRLCRYQSVSSIASDLKCSEYIINKAIEQAGYDTEFVLNYKRGKYFSDLGTVDLRSLKRKYASELLDGIRRRLNEVGVDVTIIEDNLIETDEFNAIIDFYIPEINRGYVCNNSDEMLVDENKTLIQCQCCNRINKGCKTVVKTIEYENANIWVDVKLDDGDEDYNNLSYEISNVPKVKEYTYDGLYIHPYMMDIDWGEGRFNIDTTAVRLANEIISLYRKGYVRRSTDHKSDDILDGKVTTVEEQTEGCKNEFELMMKRATEEGKRLVKKEWEERRKRDSMCKFSKKYK